MPAPPKLTPEQRDLIGQFDILLFDDPKLTFVQVATKALPKGFGVRAAHKRFRAGAKGVFDMERGK